MAKKKKRISKEKALAELKLERKRRRKRLAAKG
ncbi:hypothetical protein ABIF91_001676 [Bradyrhizobium sp. USDA 241]